MAAETAAERLHARYVDELRQSLLAPVVPRVNRRQTEALIRRARTIGPTACTEPDATTWIWSDLHLGHEPGRRDRRRGGPDPPPGTMAEGPGREVARARQSRRRPGQPDPPV